VLYIGLLLFIPLGEAVGNPATTIAVKRLAPATNMKTAYAVYYTVMNLSALASGPMTDVFRTNFSMRDLFYLGALANGAAFLLSLYGGRWLVVAPTTEDGEKPKISTTRRVLKTLWEKNFWRLVFCSLLLTGVKLIFRHLDATFPKYLLRTIGPHAKYGLVVAANPLLIVFLVPLAAGYAEGTPAFSLILRGSLVAAMSPFPLCLGAGYITAAMFVAILSVGEALYSPPTYEAFPQPPISCLTYRCAVAVRYVSGARRGGGHVHVTRFCPHVPCPVRCWRTLRLVTSDTVPGTCRRHRCVEHGAYFQHHGDWNGAGGER